jgi:hypothetical protein
MSACHITKAFQMEFEFGIVVLHYDVWISFSCVWICYKPHIIWSLNQTCRISWRWVIIQKYCVWQKL